MKQEHTEKEASVSTGFISVLALSVLFIALGSALYMNGDMSMLWFLYLTAFAFCAIGVVGIVGYFIRKEYLNLDKYGFSSGVFTLLMGICLLFRARDIAGVSMEVFGILMLLHSVILLQYALQVYMMEGSAAGLLFLFTAIEAVTAILVIVEPGRIFHRYPKVYDGALIVFGVMGIIAMLLVKFRSNALKTEKARDKNRILEDEPVTVKELPEIQNNEKTEENESI